MRIESVVKAPLSRGQEGSRITRNSVNEIVGIWKSGI